MIKWILIVTFAVSTACFALAYELKRTPCSCPSDPVHCAAPAVQPAPEKSRPAVHKRPVVNCRWVPATAYQFNEDLVLSYAQSDYHLNPKQLRLLKYCVEHHR